MVRPGAKVSRTPKGMDMPLCKASTSVGKDGRVELCAKLLADKKTRVFIWRRLGTKWVGKNTPAAICKKIQDLSH